MMAKYFIWKKFSIQVIKHTKNDFHITSTTASIFKQSKISWIFEKFSHLKLKPAPTQDKFLGFLQNEFSHSKCFQKAFFTWIGGKRFAFARARIGTHPHSSEKKLFGNILSVKIHFVKSQGIYLESGLVSSFNGWTSQKMHEILLCLTFEAFVDVIWKSFLACLITWMLNFFKIKNFAIVCSLKPKKQGFYFLQTLKAKKQVFFLQTLES